MTYFVCHVDESETFLVESYHSGTETVSESLQIKDFKITEGNYKSDVEFRVSRKAAGGSLNIVAKIRFSYEELIVEANGSDKWFLLESYNGSETSYSEFSLGLKIHWQLACRASRHPTVDERVVQLPSDSFTREEMDWMKALFTCVKRSFANSRVKLDTLETERENETKTLRDLLRK
ncbi:hypothetical protein BC938DRAFT_473899 [Jimgerdemannia flammicorona]|uniref:Uncharacterized protein n=1 Tax=Jimgerdemannia flammicorona TaxID=994334 RepID=A0A433Q348_9FUNG|nr:hypothetical protein BC938DRAFT_473899 [Jimgerdemannia flammicorona]